MPGIIKSSYIILRSVTILMMLSLSFFSYSQSINDLKNEILKITATKNAVVGVSIMDSKGNDTLSINGDRHCPLQSVFKLHIGLAVLSEVDKGKLSLDTKVKVSKKELLPNLWSPLREENPNGGSFTVARLLQYSISQSDNVACDVLIRLIGTPKTVENYIKSKGVNDVAIKINEEVMQAKWENMFLNWTTPKAANQVLKLFYENHPPLLSPSSYDFLWKTMKETSTGLDRLKSNLPANTIVAHKTGSSGTNKEGLTPATNDIGIVFLPNGDHYYISVLVTDSKESDETNARIIADISKLTWNYFTSKNSSPQVNEIHKEKWHWGSNLKQDTNAGYAQVLKVGNVLYISGAVATEVTPEGIRSVYEALARSLKSFGASFQNVVKENLYTTDIEAMKRYNDTRKAYYKSDFPAATWVQVSRLYMPDAKLEVELIAHLP